VNASVQVWVGDQVLKKGSVLWQIPLIQSSEGLFQFDRVQRPALEWFDVE
jgi:hypothetical protein